MSLTTDQSFLKGAGFTDTSRRPGFEFFYLKAPELIRTAVEPIEGTREKIKRMNYGMHLKKLIFSLQAWILRYE